MLEKIKNTFISRLRSAAYDLERVSVTGIGNSEEREDYAYAETKIDEYENLLETYFPEINVEEVKKQGIKKFHDAYQDGQGNNY